MNRTILPLPHVPLCGAACFSTGTSPLLYICLDGRYKPINESNYLQEQKEPFLCCIHCASCFTSLLIYQQLMHTFSKPVTF